MPTPNKTHTHTQTITRKQLQQQNENKAMTDVKKEIVLFTCANHTFTKPVFEITVITNYIVDFSFD